MTSDTELLREFADRQAQDAFAELVKRHLDLVYSAALRQVGGDGHLARDVAQAVFIDLARKAGTLGPRVSVAGWLYKGAHYAAANAVRAERRRRVHEQEAQAMHEINHEAGEHADWTRLRPMIDDAMFQLGETDREAVLRRFFLAQSFAEIGAALRMSEDTARKRIERALDKLHALLARRGIRSTTAALGAVLAGQAMAASPPGLAATVTGSALASASAVAAPAVSILQFMSTSKIIAGAAGLVLVLAFGTAGYEIHANREAQAAADTASRENDALLAKLRASLQRAEAADRAVADLQKSLEAAEQQRTAQAAARAGQATRAAEGDAFMARHPEVKRAAIDRWRAQRAGMYGPLFKSLGLSPAQIEQFKDLAVQGIYGITTGPSGERISYSLGGDAAEARRQMRALLGDEGYRQYREFADSGAPALQLTTELAGTLFDTPAALTATQGEQIMRILTENRAPVEGSSQLHFEWEAIIRKARGALSEPQMEMLEIYRAADEYHLASIQILRRSQPPTQQPSGAVSPRK